MKYLLSTGSSTDQVEYYILDLFKIAIQVYPGDIIGAPGIGFNFLFNDVKKDEIVSEIKSRVSQLANQIKNRFNSSRYNIEVTSIEILDETRVRITITVNENISDTITLDVYE